jgi:hypothetical protein
LAIFSPVEALKVTRRNSLAELEIDVLGEPLVQLELLAHEGREAAGRLLAGSIPCTRNPVMTSGLFTASATASLNLATMAAGVPAGAKSPNQPIALYFGIPASAMVGTCGSVGDLASPLTASALTEPASMNGTMPAIGPK